MISGLDKRNARRMWTIPNFSVYGLAGQPRLEYLVVEDVAGSKTIYYGETAIESVEQAVLFSSLYDRLGNSLPADIKAPAVIVQSKNASAVFLVGDPTNAGFSIARDSNAASPLMADLIVIEMGR